MIDSFTEITYQLFSVSEETENCSGDAAVKVICAPDTTKVDPGIMPIEMKELFNNKNFQTLMDRMDETNTRVGLFVLKEAHHMYATKPAILFVK
jgi:hypothetical protein